MAFQVLLYYKFVSLPDPEAVAARQRELCERLGLRGRVLLATEGINGTLSGPEDACAEYMEETRKEAGFEDLWFKIDEAEKHAFPRLSIKVRPEIVTLGVPCRATEHTGALLEPAQWREMMRRPDALILDIRNEYEYEIGHFEGAVRPPVETFKEFPAWLSEQLAGAEDRPVLTYCTGGIRCEKLTAYLLEQGVPNVYQLHGGIVSYGKDPEVRGEGWQGECFVFDDRVSVPINPLAGPTSACRHCGASTSRYQNCAAVECNLLYTCCEECSGKFEKCCGSECEASDRKRRTREKLDPALRGEGARLRRARHRAKRKALKKALESSPA